ncbi:MAG TPA: hypothetical protein EYP87_07395 [Flavobacteriaceae bacterium]|nr:hypothetical protein [Flavobacteriaceae bacterium]
MKKTTQFPVDIPTLKKRASEFANVGTPYTINKYGNSIEKHLEDNLGQFHFQLFKNDTLSEYIWFYCLKAALYEQSYKYESNDEFDLHDYQANELTYHSIFAEIDNDALNYGTTNH